MGLARDVCTGVTRVLDEQPGVGAQAQLNDPIGTCSRFGENWVM